VLADIAVLIEQRSRHLTNLLRGVSVERSESPVTPAAAIRRADVTRARRKFLRSQSLESRLALRLLGTSYMAQTAAISDERRRPLQATLNSLRREIENTAVPHIRRRLGSQVDTLRASMEDLINEMWTTLRQCAEELGYMSYLAAYDEWKALGCLEAGGRCRTILEGSAAGYDAVVERWSAQFLSGRKVQRHDIPWIVRGQSWPQGARPLEVAGMIRRLARDLGLDELLNRNVTLDLEARSNKASRPFCSAVSPPAEVYLVLTPSGRLCDLEETLHELGHALMFSAADPSLPLLRRVAVDDSSAEAFAFLFGSLATDPGFITFSTGLRSRQAIALSDHFKSVEIYLIRRYCVKTLFALTFLSATPTASACIADYGRLTKRFLGFGAPRWLGPQDLERGLYCWEYVRAWVGSRMLRRQLVDSFGTEWYRSRAAGRALIDLWRLGPSQPLESLLGPLDESHLLRDIRL
jgi:hypothetical protein